MNGQSIAAIQDDELTPADALSPRELQVVNLVVDGLTNGAIAARLSVSRNTVKYHLKSIMQKLHLQNRAQVAAYAAQHGWLNHKVHPGEA